MSVSLISKEAKLKRDSNIYVEGQNKFIEICIEEFNTYPLTDDWRSPFSDLQTITALKNLFVQAGYSVKMETSALNADRRLLVVLGSND